jgi:hypothetical protein
MSQSSLSSILSVNLKLVAALQKYLPKKTIVLAGKVWAVTDLVTAFTDENHDIAVAASAKAALTKASSAAKADRTANDPLRSALHQAVLVQFGQDPQVLEDFGYKVPRKRGPVSAETKVIAVAKRRATRAARGTLGSRQRQAIHGAPQELTVSVTATPAAAATPSNGTTQK